MSRFCDCDSPGPGVQSPAPLAAHGAALRPQAVADRRNNCLRNVSGVRSASDNATKYSGVMYAAAPCQRGRGRLQQAAVLAGAVLLAGWMCVERLLEP